MVVAGPDPARAETPDAAHAWTGIAYRPALASWIDTRPREIECLEITAEQFYKGGEALARSLASAYPVVVHTSRLSLGTPGTLDRQELGWFVSLIREVDPPWISEHLGFRRTDEVDLGFPTPTLLNADTLSLFTDHCREVMDRCGTRLLVENITSPLAIRGAISEPDFFNRLCKASGSGVLVDVTALVVNSRNHGFDARSWLGELEPSHIVQLHLGGARRGDDAWLDTHGDPVDDEVWALAADVLTRAPVRAIVLERDEHFPPVGQLAAELRRGAALAGGRIADTRGHSGNDP
jgi:uncharacterized protein (UPF0276 family)